ncbi:hypothetical protein MRX96_015196 [Rhipicephalus microplus]
MAKPVKRQTHCFAPGCSTGRDGIHRDRRRLFANTGCHRRVPGLATRGSAKEAPGPSPALHAAIGEFRRDESVANVARMVHRGRHSSHDEGELIIYAVLGGQRSCLCGGANLPIAKTAVSLSQLPMPICVLIRAAQRQSLLSSERAAHAASPSSRKEQAHCVFAAAVASTSAHCSLGGALTERTSFDLRLCARR